MIKKAAHKPLARLVIILLLCPVILYGCGDDDGFLYYDHCDCDDEMEIYVAIYGQPEEIHRYYDAYDDFHRHIWWYWSQGFRVTFEWYRYWYIDDGECCEVSEHALRFSYDESGRLIIDLLKEEKEGMTEKPNHP